MFESQLASSLKFLVYLLLLLLFYICCGFLLAVDSFCAVGQQVEITRPTASNGK